MASLDKDEIMDRLKSQVQFEIDQAETYLDEKIRPKIAENWEYYRGNRPGFNKDESSFVSNDSADVVDHYVATCVDAFNSNDTLEIRPQGITNPGTLKVINRVINDILDNENNRYKLYQSFFTDAMVSSASIFKPYRKVETDVETEFFKDVPLEELNARFESLETSGTFKTVVMEISEQRTEVQESVTPVQPGSQLSGLLSTLVDDADVLAIQQEITYCSGHFKLFKDRPTIKIEHIPAENFIINEDARGIDDARIVGHKAMVTISDLLRDFDEDVVREVFESANGDDDAETNIASTARASKYVDLDSGGDSFEDNANREIELYELYLRSSYEEQTNDEDSIHIAKLYRVFYAGNIVLESEEVDFIPYAGSSVITNPFMFWGDGMVDRVRHIQRASSGLVRQQLTHNELVNKPRFQYVRDQIVNPADIVNPKAGAGIAVKAIGAAIAPIQVMQPAGDNLAMIQYMQSRREASTGMVTTGQSLMGEALKAGASTISAQMILSEDQMLRKGVIKTLLEGVIKILIKNIYEIMRDEFDEWEVTVDDQVMIVNPNQWPRIREIRVVTPLGSSAKLEKAAALEGEYQRMATAQGEAAKLFKPEGMRKVLDEMYELRDIPQVSSWLASPQEIQMKDQMVSQMNQLTQQLQQVMAQVQTLTQTNQQLQLMTNHMAERELAIKENNQKRLQEETSAKIENMADKQITDEEKAEAQMQLDADKQALEEEKFEQFKEMARIEAENPDVSYGSV